jgi:acyl-CoA synthetase (AMP-forming)/AMP-acid ligase II
MTPEPRNIPDLLQQRATLAPDKTFLFSEADERQFTYTEFVDAVGRAAGMLAARASSRVACRTVPRVSSVFAGLMFSAVRVDADSTHLPLIKLR